MRKLLALLLAITLSFGLTGCATTAPPDAHDAVPGATLQDTETDSGAAAAESDAPAAADEKKDESRGFLTGALLYLPNRVVDLFDVAKVGVDVGPGIGIDFQATSLLQARAMTSLTFGIGFQGLRHLPFQAGTVALFGIGPLGANAQAGGWHRSSTEIRVGLHVLIIGAHVGVDPWEILDFVLGILTIDIADDDF